jgi:glycogen debranching enzyme
VTNGLGGFACGTVSGANTRRYHGFLVASLRPPVERTLLVAKVEMSIDYAGVDYLGPHIDLSANEFADGTISGQGFVHLESFAVRDGIPTWRYAQGDALLEQQIFMTPGANTSYLRVECLRASAPLRVTLKPLVTYRDYHSQGRGARPFKVDADADQCTVRAFDGARPYRITISQGRFDVAPEWYLNFRHREEAERGLDALEDLLMPGTFSTELVPELPVYLTATAESSTPLAGAEVLDALKSTAQRLPAALPKTAPCWIRTLAQATDQFIVRRDGVGPAAATASASASASGAGSGSGSRSGSGSATSIIAGYPWFTDWGRDAMIALPGLATSLGRFDIAANVLESYLGFVDGGMLPNCFPDRGEAPAYNTADATLWMFHALDDYLQAKPDPDLVRAMFPTLLAILHAHAEGTRYGIHMDPADGLLHAGEPGTQLTWMDAKHGDVTFTPRIGKPVEINALWLNALDVAARLAVQVGNPVEASFCYARLSHAGFSFSRFWNADRSCLYDVIDVDGGSGSDARVRPNQIIAVALPYCPLPPAQMRAVVDCCGRELLTSYGLRSLSPRDPGYIGTYAGDPAQRDGAYHMGTVWAWLLGPFVRAHYRVYGDARLARSFLDAIREHLDSACLGTVSEIFDGDAPHTARGCFAQAWSVAEILRSWVYLDRRIDLDNETPTPRG